MTTQAGTNLSLRVNGESRSLTVPTHATLLQVLRDDLRLTGTNHGCDLGECGACTVLVDGEPVLSCLSLAHRADGAEVTTVEGLGDGAPHPLQTAFVEEGAAQCGYCTPGMLVTGAHFLETHPDPERADVVDAISGNLCRCTGYAKIVDAIAHTAEGAYR